ncbi:MAG: Gfo/Idh/MocA family oxidoreductase [Armatimonadetes bacterium]|nr:Gfo/Idh/MocA family oxidoreductase [Armatimonadota bacterium]
MPDAPAITASELSLDLAFAMPERPWRIGCVGFGGIARHAHAPAYRAMGWPIVAAADPNPDARGCARDEFGIGRLYEGWQDLIADPNVDVVDLLTHPNTREDVVAAAAEAGKPIVTEKPFAVTLAEAERMTETARGAGIPLAVHQNYRWMPTRFVVRRLIEGGWIGLPFYASIEIFGTQDRHLYTHPFYSVCDDFLTLQWNSHLADLLRYWTDCDPIRVFTYTGRMGGQRIAADNLLVSIHDFAPGLTGHIAHHELLQSDMPSQPCRIDGSEGSVVFDLWGPEVTLQSSRLGGGPRTLRVADLGLPSSFAGSMGSFLRAIETGEEPPVSGRRNLATLKVIFAEHDSARNRGQWVSVG